MRTKQKGQAVRIDYTFGRPALFKAGGRRRYEIGDSGMVAVNCTVKFADGTLAYGVIELDESSSGENHGVGIFMLDGDFLFQGETGFLKKLHKTKKEVFPYKYRYDTPVECSDHHVGDDGWSF